VDDNPIVEFHPCDRTNDTALIRANEKVTAINSALEIDLTGQVVADSIGYRTDYGAVTLFGRSLRQRAEALISVAHPDVRGDLRRAAVETRSIVLGAS
jgi:4-hydroxybutyrate CoA-transferase